MLYRMPSAREERYIELRDYYIKELATEKERLMEWKETDTSYNNLLDLIILIGRGDPDASKAVAEIKLAHTLSRSEAAGEVFNFCLEHQIVGKKFYYLYDSMCQKSFEVMACTIAMLKTGIFTEEDIQEAFIESPIAFIDRESPEFKAIIENNRQSELFPKYNSIFHQEEWNAFCKEMKSIFDRQLAIEKENRKSRDKYNQKNQKESKHLREIIINTQIFLEQIGADYNFEILAPTLNSVYWDSSTCKLEKGHKNCGSKLYPNLLSGNAVRWQTTQEVDEEEYDVYNTIIKGNKNYGYDFGYDQEKDIFHFDVDGEDCAIVAAVKGANPDQLLAIQNRMAEEMDGKCELEWIPAEFIMKTCEMCGGPYSINGNPVYPNEKSDYILVAKGYEKLRVDNNTDTDQNGRGKR